MFKALRASCERRALSSYCRRSVVILRLAFCVDFRRFLNEVRAQFIPLPFRLSVSVFLSIVAGNLYRERSVYSGGFWLMGGSNKLWLFVLSAIQLCLRKFY